MIGQSIASIYDLGALRLGKYVSALVVYISYGPPYHTIHYTYLLLVAMAMPETSKEKTGVYIVYTPASWVINLPGALSSYFSSICFLSKVYIFYNCCSFSHFLCQADAVHIACITFAQHVHVSPCHVMAVYTHDIP